MSDTDLRDFACSACGGMLPGIPSHGEQGTYCSSYCRVWIEGEPKAEEDEDD